MVSVIILVPAHATFRIGYGNQVVTFIIPIGDYASVWQGDRGDAVVLICGQVKELP